MRDLPTGTVTLLFTDIEGSTRLLHEIGAGYADALASHRAALREAFGRHGGVEVDTAGDAFFYAFADASAAVAAATDGQAALADGPIRVRMGLHTGEPIVTDEGYVGIDVHHAARVMAAGHGGQVLVSEATATAVADGTLVDLGRHRLKDMTAAEHLFQVGAGDFPPLKTLDATNLPVAATALLGRVDEVQGLASLLTNGARLVSVTGPGGMGKTRLALQAASELVGAFRDGVFWVPLAAITDVDLMLPEVARTIGASDLLPHLRDREMLLLLDNLEQLDGASEPVGELLANGPRCRVLATSRTPLHVAGEHEFPLGPLEEEAAVVLFCERARATGRVVEPDEHVRAICRRLDGLPLALELAAARTKLLAPAALLSRLDRTLSLLTGGAADRPERHRTLRATIAWSHDLLDEAGRELFARLGVFAGGASLDAVEQVCGADLDQVQQLVDSSLLKVMDQPDGGTRLLMLETIREYAVEQLAADPLVADATARRHAEFYAGLAQHAWADRRRASGVADAVRRLEIEHPNFIAAEAWAHERQERVLQLRLLTGADSLFLRGSQSNFHAHLLDALNGDIDDALLLGRAHTALSFVSYRLGDLAAADAAATRALELGEQSGDRATVGTAYNYLSNRHNAEGRAAEARDMIERSKRVWQELGDDRGVLVCQVNLVDVSLSARDYERALSDAQAVLPSARRFGDPDITSVAAVNAALACLHLGRLGESAEFNREALEVAQGAGDQATVVCCLRVAAAQLALAGNLSGAARTAGLMERMRVEIELDLEPSEKVLQEDLFGKLAPLGADAVRAEMAAGAQMTVDEVLASG